MNMKFDERDYGYTVISRLETAIREIILSKNEINNDNWNIYIPEGVKNSAKDKKCEIENIEELLDNIDFIQLKEIIIYKDNYNLFFDENIFSKEKFIKCMESLYLLRNKISHVKQYFSYIDLSSLLNETKTLIDKINYDMSELQLFMSEILVNPDKLAVKIPLDFLSDDKIDNVINNLPSPDYDLEGGYVGRTKDKKEIIDMIKKDKHPVITVSGAGGVGKTAFTLNVVNEIINKQIVKYDFVVWVSAKENKLTYLGIEDIEPSLKNYNELLDTILEVSGFAMENNVDDENEKEKFASEVFDICDRVLIIIDNLETINDERIINFILDGHKNVRFLITSRRGLGQVERRYEIKQLEEQDAITLFKVICKNKREQKLLSIGDDIIKKYVNKVYRYPLAIKWTIAQVSNGKDINDVINSINEQNTDISKFCFEQIFSELTDADKYILFILSMYDMPIQKGTIKFISDFDESKCFDSISKLLLLSLIIPEDVINENTKEIIKNYSIMPLTKGFVLAKLDENTVIKARIHQKLIMVENRIEEAQRAKKAYKYSLNYFGATTDEEKIASVLCQTAFQQYQTDGYYAALQTYKRAIAIAPKFVCIYRNWAIMESNEGHIVEADKLMEKATNINPNDVQMWLVWGNIKRRNERINDADKYYKKAFELSPNDVIVMNSYAQAESRLGNYEFANELFERALNYNDNSNDERHNIINTTSLSENLLKWSEANMKNNQYDKALILSKKALENIRITYNKSKNDTKSRKVYYKALMNTAKILYINKNYDEAEKNYLELINIKYFGYFEREQYVRGCLGLARVYDKKNSVQKSKSLLKTIEREIYRINKQALIAEYKQYCLVLNDKD